MGPSQVTWIQQHWDGGLPDMRQWATLSPEVGQSGRRTDARRNNEVPLRL